MKNLILFLFITSAVVLASASVGPDYTRPALATASAYRDVSPPEAGAWKTAEPGDAFGRGAWWQLFGDAVLDGLESRALAANQDLKAGAARVEQARAAAGLARSAYFPSVAFTPSATRERYSGTTDNGLPQQQSTTYRAGVDASWEIDLFGRVRRLNEAARATADASAANFEAVRLALTAEVAANYFSLGAIDRELALVTNGIELRRRALKVITTRRASGTATDFDVARAETELATTEAELAGLRNQRGLLQTALAVLLGEQPSAFEIAAATPALTSPPEIPAGLPAALLERRPDIAAAERGLAASNARIGVAKAAFFPAIALTGSAGFASGDIDRLTQSDSRIWSIGPSLYLPIFQGGRNRANLARNRAAYEESVAVYRQQVLVAFREVQDALTASRWLAEQGSAQDRSVTAARRAGTLAQTRFDAGYVNLLEVLDAERTVLAAERASARLAGQRMITAVTLIKSLGGGWHAPVSGPQLAQK